jgi:hypothetical protein
MKEGVKEIVGKRVIGIVVAENKLRDPKNQLFLLFGDNSYFELYGAQFRGAGGLDDGGVNTITECVKEAGGVVKLTYFEQTKPGND